MDLGFLEATLAELGEPAYRVRQVWERAARGAAGYGSMTALPATLRRRLDEQVPFSTLSLVTESHARDGTVKALFQTADGRPVEAVLMRYRDGRRSVCLSSQSGCPLTCSFCATGRMPFGRNLTAWEIVDQALHFLRLVSRSSEAALEAGSAGREALPARDAGINHCVFMGMGEPMMNLDAVLGACRLLPDLGVSHRRTAVSTVGWVPGIRRLAEADLPVRLAISLHAPDDSLRSQLMPVNDRYPLRDVLTACAAYHERRRRKVFVEYVLLAGVNDRVEQARALAALLDPRIYKVNLIPYNPTGAFEASTPKAIAAFRAVLDRAGMSATVRLTRGREIEAACGQLAAAKS